MNSDKTHHSIWPLAPFLLGIIVFIAVTGGAILWPQNVDWLMDGDPATHWLGWQFFRQAPFFQWPWGANPAYGMEIGSSIVFTDSIPVMALIFKPLSPWLPETFQYIGIWVLLCFMLQTYFAWKLLSLITPNRWLALVGSAFFAIAPVYMSRLGMHYALFGQWVLVASLYLYRSKQFSLPRWLALLSIVALIHAYLLAMVLAVWMTDLVQRRWTRQITIARVGASLLGGLCLVAFVMWGAGYFMLKAGVQSGGFGFYRMNFFSLFDSNGVWSELLPDVPNMPGDYEGFSFLGIGLILLGAVALAILVSKKIQRENARFVPLAVLSALLLIYALSDHIAVGASESIQYTLPELTKRITDTFRVSGRFVWPVYYVIYLGVFYLIFTHTKGRTAILLCCAALALQIVDSRQAVHNLRAALNEPPKWESPLRSPAWKELAGRYDKLIYVLPTNQPKPWLALSEFAAMHKMKINVGYFARTNPDVEKSARDALIATIAENRLDPKAIYVFENDYLWDLVHKQGAGADLTATLDGYRILAPGLGDCDTCDPGTVDELTDATNPRFDYAGGTLSFASNGNGAAHQIFGWGGAEPWGTWSSGKSAMLRVNFLHPPIGDLQLIFKAHAFVNEKLKSQTVQIIINGEKLGSFQYVIGDDASLRRVRIPESLIRKSSGKLTIRLIFNGAASPTSLDMSADPRVLALGLESMEIIAAPMRP